MSYSNRQRAIALKAADARTLLNSTLPFVLKHMTAAQIAQVQRVLDAAVVNPEVKKEADSLYQKSVRAQSGQIVMRDPGIVRRADRVIERGMIHVTERDKRVHLNFNVLLAPLALKPTTDNSDEAAYLARVNSTLVSRGVWLRFNQPLVRDPSDFGKWAIDPRKFEAWLSIGPDGDKSWTIPTRDGHLTREALLGTQALGAGYYENVHQGTIQRALDKQINRVLGEIENMRSLHQNLERARDTTALPGVAKISDVLGGAEFPSQKIWERPHKLVMRALELNVGGNVIASHPFTVAATLATVNATRLLKAYMEDTKVGAERAVTVLKVLKILGEIAEVLLMVVVPGAGAIRAARGGSAVVLGAGERAVAGSLEERLKQNVTKFLAENPEFAAELSEVRAAKGPPGTKLGSGARPGQSSGAGKGDLY
jgi:hypothetical protein